MVKGKAQRGRKRRMSASFVRFSFLFFLVVVFGYFLLRSRFLVK